MVGMTAKKRLHPDHVRQRNMPSVYNEAFEQRLQELLTTAVFSQLRYHRQLKIRARILTLP